MPTKMKTQVFETYHKFLQRPDKTVNGVSPTQFYASNKDAMADIERCAKEEKEQAK